MFVCFVDHCVLSQGHTLISFSLDRQGQLEISSDIIEVLHERVAQGDPLVQQGVTGLQVNLAQVDLIDTNHRVLEDPFGQHSDLHLAVVGVSSTEAAVEEEVLVP